MANATMKGLDIVKIVDKLVKCLEEQEKVNIEYVLAFLQKLIGWAIVIISVQGGLEIMNIVGALFGLITCECADMWYRLTTKLEKSAQLMVGKP